MKAAAPDQPGPAPVTPPSPPARHSHAPNPHTPDVHTPDPHIPDPDMPDSDMPDLHTPDTSQKTLPPASVGASLSPAARVRSEAMTRGFTTAGPDGPNASPPSAPSGAQGQLPAPPAFATAAILRPIESPRPAPQAARLEQPSAPAEEPAQTTYIHIGRVELHAALPAVTIQRTASKSAAHQHMSLEEYLRRRSGRPQ
jgi:periplasmic protein TonB